MTILIDIITGSDRKALVRTASKFAHSQLSDEEAREQLRQEVQKHRRGRQNALRILAYSRDEFEGDRAYRLLEAAMTDTSVRPIAPSSAELFSREGTLGRRPIGEAFSYIKELVPKLAELEEMLVTEYEGQPGILKSPPDFANAGRHLTIMVGPNTSELLDPLARSQLALTIATQYFAILAGDSRYGDMSTPYFSAPRRLYVRSGVIGGSFPEPPSSV
jgi:hypothetical protein